MFLEKLSPSLNEVLLENKFEEPTTLQKKVFNRLVSGVDLVISGPAQSGKTAMINITLIHQLKEPFEDAPRALVIVSDKAKALDMLEQFKQLAGRDLRMICAYDGGPLDIQRDDIYGGADVVVATPKRIQEIYFQNGINLNKIKWFIIDDGQTISHNTQVYVDRMFQSIPKKSQRIIFANNVTERMEILADEHMPGAQYLEFGE